MSQYIIIEDCSPYYIRFTFDGLLDVIEYIKSLEVESRRPKRAFSNNTFSVKNGTNIVSKLPMFKDFNWQYDRVSIFKTPPGKCSSIHKDGSFTEVGLNIPLTILDNKCITSWYADELFKSFLVPYTRIVSIDNFDFPTLKETILQPNEMVLFNVGIFHGWQNKSENIREVLTLRFNEVGPDNNRYIVSFDDAKRILFNKE